MIIENYDLRVLQYNTTKYKNFTLLNALLIYTKKKFVNISLYLTNVGTVVYDVITVPNWARFLKQCYC